ncbi:hypothetical protein ES703_32825 [subsurface metagenome]
MKKLILISSVIIISLALLFTGCFKSDCPAPDGSKITAHRGTTATGGMIISGAPGAVEPGATVTITDGEGNSVTTTADENGGFLLMEADLPMDFDHTLGNNLSVTQKSENCNESPAVDVEIVF